MIGLSFFGMDKEKILLSTLRGDGRASLTTISRKTRIPVSTLFEVLKRTDKIERHTCLLNFRECGFSIRALFFAKIESQDRERFKEFILKHPNLNNFSKVNNGFDYYYEMVFSDLQSCESFAEDVEKDYSVLMQQIHYVVNDLAREVFWENEQKCELYPALK